MCKKKIYKGQIYFLEIPLLNYLIKFFFMSMYILFLQKIFMVFGFISWNFLKIVFFWRKLCYNNKKSCNREYLLEVFLNSLFFRNIFSYMKEEGGRLGLIFSKYFFLYEGGGGKVGFN